MSEYTVDKNRIPTNDKTHHLRKLEEEIVEKIEEASIEYLRLQGVTREQITEEFWLRGLPSELFFVLQAWDSGAQKAACEAYLEYVERLRNAEKTAEVDTTSQNQGGDQ